MIVLVLWICPEGLPFFKVYNHFSVLDCCRTMQSGWRIVSVTISYHIKHAQTLLLSSSCTLFFIYTPESIGIIDLTCGPPFLLSLQSVLYINCRHKSLSSLNIFWVSPLQATLNILTHYYYLVDTWHFIYKLVIALLVCICPAGSLFYKVFNCFFMHWL